MNRRNFFSSAAVLSTAPLMSSFAISGPTYGKAIIADIEFWQLSGTRNASEGFVGWIQSKPSQVYPEARNNPALWKPESGSQPYSAIYLKIICKDGLHGMYGPIDMEPAIVINRQIKPYLIGKDALSIELIWDQLFRNYRHSRAGLYMMAISAVDNALWDLRGHSFEAPVYRLLGGPTRNKVEFYASCLGFSVEPAEVKKRCQIVKNMGFNRQKWFFAYGTGDGISGVNKNVELVRVLRETLGNDTEIMFDAFMGWDLDFATAWATQAEQYRPAWIEEPFMANELELFRRFAEKTNIPIATGEHIYNRWEVLEYLKSGALSIVQSDPEWCGGVSELVKICNLASAFGVKVIPHGHCLRSALHVIASQSPSVAPFGEFLINKMDHHYLFEKNPPVISGGSIALDDKPGFGIEWDDSRIEKKQKLIF
jgi:L-rhamnonate dehydratase